MRPWLWVGIAVAIVLIASAAVVTWRQFPTAQPPATPSATSTPTPVPTTTAPPEPGLEPPRPGTWPRAWPKLSRPDTHTIALEGLGEVTFPLSWNCQPAEPAVGEARYTCGREIDGDQDIGGEIILRPCSAPCDPDQQTANRATEDAWGLQWRFAGTHVTLAETLTHNDQPQRYGLVVIAYYRTGSSGPPNRQVVLRMASPESWLDEIRRVANSIRDTARF
jgi:hypothetical protein